MLMVTNLTNKRTVVVRVNDRGPFIKGRIIDLSYAAAQKIDMISAGVVKVKVEEVR
jgi:rare lipoprotein A